MSAGLKRMMNEIRDVAAEICSEWEYNFLQSIEDQLSRGRRLSERQREIVEDLYEKACEYDGD